MTTYKGKTVKAKLGKTRIVGKVIDERGTDDDTHRLFIETSEVPRTGIAIYLRDGWKIKVIEEPAPVVQLIELPTKPYALIVPPKAQEIDDSAFILEYCEDSLVWQQYGGGVDDRAVIGALRDGWTVAFEGREES